MTLSKTTKFSAIFQTALLFILALALALTVPLILAQKEGAPARKDDSVYAELAKAPKKAVARRNPMEHDPEAVGAGEKLFGLHCAECHGDKRRGAPRHARVVKAARAATLAARDLCQVAWSSRKISPVTAVILFQLITQRTSELELHIHLHPAWRLRGDRLSKQRRRDCPDVGQVIGVVEDVEGIQREREDF